MVILGDFEPFSFLINMFFFLLLVIFILNNFMNTIFNRMTFKMKILIKDFVLSEKIFLFIILINFCGLSGSWESFSGWPMFSLSLSFLCWFTVIIRWMNKNLFNMISHLTPLNLNFFFVLILTFIEILSNMIRPLTLGMRLCANILGGHLILDLMSEMNMSISYKFMLTMYESFVCFMQSLIFSLLIMSYFEEGS